ncbi:MAG: glycosyltransferase, partial [Candidatus Manganitrophaceae bacterium]
MSQRLKILFLTNRSPLPITDGQSRRTYNILKGLAERHEVYLLSLQNPDEPLDEKSLLGLKSICAHVELHPGPSKKVGFSMAVRLLGSLFSLDPYTIWRHYSRSYLDRIHALVDTFQFDLVHCDILPLAYTMRSVHGVPKVFTDHDVSYLKAFRMAQQSGNPFFKLFLSLEAIKVKRLESRIFKEVDIGIAVSEVDKKALMALCPEGKIEVVENGVDTKEFKPVSQEVVENSLVWVGGFDNYPNREGIYFFLEEVYPLIRENVPGVRIDLVGGGVTPRLREIASADPSIHIAGYVNDPLPYIQKAALFIVPILSGSGTRLKLLEAMAAGKAIVTTRVGCEGIEGVNRKHYLIADESSDFAKYVAEILKDANLRLHLGAHAR